MNCCDSFGNCDQGANCPSRTGKVLPHQARHACQVARIKSSTRPVWMDGKAAAVPPEAGNVRLPPVDQDDMGPLGHEETMALIWALFGWFMAVVCIITVMALAVGYSTERWADVFLAYLSGLS